MTKTIRYLLFFTVFLANCSNTKYLTNGQTLYVGGKVNIVNKDIKKNDKKALSEELVGLLRPKPNGTILGLRPKLYIYNITKTTKKKGLKHYLNTKFGEPPVLASAVDLTKNSSILQNRLQNEGYFQAQVTGDTVTKSKKTTAIYTANTGPGYTIRKLMFPTGKDNLDTAIAGTAKQSLLKVGDKYNLDVIKSERDRIDANLKEKGFYYFSGDDLIARVDSTDIGNHQVDMSIVVKDKTANKARNIYRMNNIYVYPNYSLRDTSLMLDSAVKYNNYYVIQKRKTIKPFVFKNTVQLQPGNVYNRTDHNKSLNRFINLGPFKYVKNRFENVSTDSSKLNVFYFLTQYPRKSLSFDVLGRTTSANYNGAQLNLNFRNRNTFKGAELLTVTVFGSTDAQVSGQFGGGHPLTQLGLQTTLSWPRFISPFKIKSDNAFIPRTNFSLGYSIVNRTGLYNLNSFNGSFGYQWKQDIHKTHELNLLAVTYVKPSKVDTAYTNSIIVTGNPALKHVIDPQFTFGPSYSYTYTNTTETYRTNTIYYSSRISESGILVGLFTGADTLAGKSKTIFNTPFNQYIKLENEFRFFHKVSSTSQIAARIIASAGLPYGNSTILPYSQQFFIGGPNSLRGFRARSIGPGSVNPTQYGTTGGFLADQSGDIKLEGSVEYRPKLFSIVYGALFADAGNVWNAKPHQAGGTFGKDFLNQMAADVGFGLRFDVTVLVLRTDLGFPILQPYTSTANNLNNNKPVFNLAIGYPF
ncbi:translocation and assembly module lipoprotein TamL [Mucilaginibacter arboris]|uniref:BamA/TamA family outer membrane protein n=1 Tax=Mucilaginibacter arboris TaxID=2682090 RepID=A0A7K1SUF3_9SPHI|nr:BamA/TamA family outer membrane protein [Mucilaginibacter arboris]MVN20868.1 BamA/TamA family outer membrane protein [Mucilaginibacter arboris]